LSEQNPYDKYLDGRPLDAILAATPSELASLLEKMGAERSAQSPAPGKWSPAQIICHLTDCELAFGFRLRQTLAEENHVIQPFDQDKWAATYAGIAAAEALATFFALRSWNLALIRKTLPTSAGRAVLHPERGAMTFQTLVETMAGHDVNHLNQLRRIAG
jgi:hypothetical protein